MLKKVIVLAIIILPFTSVGQTLRYKLSLSQLIALYNKDQSEINDYLLAKNWGLEEVVQETEKYDAGVSWTYKNDRGSSGFLAFYEISFNKDQGNVRCRYQFGSLEIYNALKADASSLKMEKVKSGIYDENLIYTDHVGVKYAVRFVTGKDIYGNRLFNVLLFNKNYYYRNIFGG